MWRGGPPPQDGLRKKLRPKNFPEKSSGQYPLIALNRFSFTKALLSTLICATNLLSLQSINLPVRVVEKNGVLVALALSVSVGEQKPNSKTRPAVLHGYAIQKGEQVLSTLLLRLEFRTPGAPVEGVPAKVKEITLNNVFALEQHFSVPIPPMTNVQEIKADDLIISILEFELGATQPDEDEIERYRQKEKARILCQKLHDSLRNKPLSQITLGQDEMRRGCIGLGVWD